MNLKTNNMSQTQNTNTKFHNMDTEKLKTQNHTSLVTLNHKQYTNLVDACWTHLQHNPEDQEVLKTIQHIMDQVMG